MSPEQTGKKDEAAAWFHSKWGVPEESYRQCMEDYLTGQTEYGRYLCLDGERIVGGLGVIENDFHERENLAPNVCAVYTEEDCREKGISPLYLLTAHVRFYERYGWEFLCMVQAGEEIGRMYIHR